MTGFDINGNPFSASTAGESFHISSPEVPGGYVPDLILSHIGISRTSAGYLFALVESPGGPVSDYIWVHQFIPQFTVIDFVSDTDAIALGLPSVPSTTIVENGGLQLVGSYLNDRGDLVLLQVQSDASVPDGSTTLLLMGLAVPSLAAFKRLTNRRASRVG